MEEMEVYLAEVLAEVVPQQVQVQEVQEEQEEEEK